MKKWNSLTLNQQLAQIEVTEEQRIPMQRKYAVRCALSGIGFGVLMTIFDAL